MEHGDEGANQAMHASLVAKQQSLCNREADARLFLWNAFFLSEVIAQFRPILKKCNADIRLACLPC